MSNDPRDELKHPMQPVDWDGKGVIRFKANAIVRWMLEQGQAAKGFDLNTIAAQDFSDEDRMQLAQLIGYSVSGYGDLGYVSNRSFAQADRRADKVREP